MQHFQEVVTSPTGRPIVGATITVTHTSGGAAATLYSGNGTGLLGSNVLTSDSNGQYDFYTYNGRYTLTIAATGYATDTLEISVYDADDLAEVGIEKFGLLTAGADSSAVFQAAFTAAVADKLRLVVPPGTWDARDLDIAGRIVLCGRNFLDTVLKLRNSSNVDLITVAPEILDGIVIHDLTLEGNLSNNITGRGLYLPEDTVSSYGFGVNLARVQIQNFPGIGIEVQPNRNMGHMARVILKRNQTNWYITGSSDWKGTNCELGFARWHNWHCPTGADNKLAGSSLYGAELSCVLWETTNSSPCSLVDCTLDVNEREAIEITGSAGSYTPHLVSGCYIHDNSQETTNTYSHVTVTNSSGAIFTGNRLRQVATNVAKYVVEFGGSSSGVIWDANNLPPSGTMPYGTALTNTPAYLLSQVVTLKVSNTAVVEGAATLGGLSGSQSLQVQPGVSGGDYAQVQGRASGTGPDITSQGSGADVRLRLSSKGASAVEVWTAGLTNRIARFMDTASAVNRWDIYAGATGGAVRLVAAGETNIDAAIEPAGTGLVKFGTYVGTPLTAAGYFEMKTTDGTVRKVMVGT